MKADAALISVSMHQFHGVSLRSRITRICLVISRESTILTRPHVHAAFEIVVAMAYKWLSAAGSMVPPTKAHMLSRNEN